MADPLSIAASIAGILTLAVQVSNGLAQIISDANTAESLLTELTDDLLVLCEILAKLEGISTWRESASDHLLPTTLKRCDDLLKELQAIIVMVQESIARGGLQKRWVQITWSSKQKQITIISAKIAEHKSNLMLTLQMQNAFDMGDVKNAIHNFLESKCVQLERNDRQRESMERYMKSTTSSFYSTDRAPSYPPSSLFASSGSSFHSGFSFRSSASFRTCRDTPEPTGSDDITLIGSGNSEPESCSETSSSTLIVLPATNLEWIQIPASLLDPDPMGAEQMWAGLAPHLPTTSPAPYSTFKERYFSIYPYLWLHGRLWHGNRATYGTFLVTRYSTQSGKIEFSRIQIDPTGHELSNKQLLRVLVDKTSSGLALEYLEAELAILVEAAMFGLRIVDDSPHFDYRSPRSPYSFHRVLPISATQESSSSLVGIWPPITFPAEDRATVPLLRHTLPGEHPSYSQNLFGLRKTSTRLELVTGSGIQLFSALDPKVYTPDIEHPLRGIWYWRTFAGYEFILFHQRGRNHLKGLKLTGNIYVPSGFQSFEFCDIEAGIRDWESNGNQTEHVANQSTWAMNWLSLDFLTIRRPDKRVYHFRRLDVDQFF